MASHTVHWGTKVQFDDQLFCEALATIALPTHCSVSSDMPISGRNAPGLGLNRDPPLMGIPLETGRRVGIAIVALGTEVQFGNAIIPLPTRHPVFSGRDH